MNTAETAKSSIFESFLAAEILPHSNALQGACNPKGQPHPNKKTQVHNRKEENFHQTDAQKANAEVF